MTDQEAYDQLSSDYATSGDLSFTLQHVVDAYAAQQASPTTKPISLFFALVGLCLRVEKGFSGRQVQHCHQLLARKKQTWPRFEAPAPRRAAMSVVDVARQPIGPARDTAVDRWCESVWQLYRSSHDTLLREMRARGLDV